MIDIKKFQKYISLSLIVGVVTVGILFSMFMSFKTFDYYQSKSNQWFESLPKQTILAVKLNTHKFNPVQNTKVFGIMKNLFFDQDLINEFINSKKPITLLFFEYNSNLISGVITQQPPVSYTHLRAHET